MISAYDSSVLSASSCSGSPRTAPAAAAIVSRQLGERVAHLRQEAPVVQPERDQRVEQGLQPGPQRFADRGRPQCRQGHVLPRNVLVLAVVGRDGRTTHVGIGVQQAKRLAEVGEQQRLPALECGEYRLHPSRSVSPALSEKSSYNDQGPRSGGGVERASLKRRGQAAGACYYFRRRGRPFSASRIAANGTMAALELNRRLL